MAAEGNQAPHSVEPPGMVEEAKGGRKASSESSGSELGSKSPSYRPHSLWDLTQDPSGNASSDADVMRLLQRARADLDVAIHRFDGEMRQRLAQPQRGSRREVSPPTGTRRQTLGLPEGSNPPSTTPSQRELPVDGGPRTPSEQRPEHHAAGNVFEGVMPSGRERAASSASSRLPFARPTKTSLRKSMRPSWMSRHRSTRSTQSGETLSSLHVCPDAPRSLPSLQPHGWIRRLSMDNQHSCIDHVISNLLAPRESRRAPRPLTRTQQAIKAVVTRTEYEVFRTVLIIVDAFLVVWEAECAGRQALLLPAGGRVADNLALLVLLDLTFLAFLADGILRVVADQYDFSVRAGSGWRWFNMATVSSHFLQVVAHHVHAGQRSVSHFRVIFSVFAAMRILRVVSLVQVTASIRNLNLFRELRILVHSLIGAVQSLLWCFCMGSLVLMAFGMLFSEGALAFWMRQDRITDADTTALMEDFGTLLTASLSLYKSMSGGADWGDIYASLKPLGSGFSVLYLIFITFAFIALLNVATAVFVESTMRRSHSDREMMVQSELNDKREFIDSVRKIFEEFDTNGEGITKDSLQKHMEDPKIGAYFAKLGVDVDHFEKLYNLLDRDQSGFIDLEEFTFGCVRLRGEAKCLDIEDLRISIKSACETFRHGLEGLDSFSQSVTEWFDVQKQDLDSALDGRLGQLDATLDGLCRDVSGLSHALAVAVRPQPLVHTPPPSPAEDPKPLAEDADQALADVASGPVAPMDAGAGSEALVAVGEGCRQSVGSDQVLE